jgi:outer membrane cobalamin receptor
LNPLSAALRTRQVTFSPLGDFVLRFFQLALHIAIPSLTLSSALAQTPNDLPLQQLEPVAVIGTRLSLQGTASSASEGVVRAAQLQSRPLLRPGELVEAVPGLVATQHSGEGKANQYFLRGFNLDHGTDFATYFDGMPLNLPSHAHGQGYTDLNFIIPELVDQLSFRKGPYYASEGDFSTVGSARLSTRHQLDRSFSLLELGQRGYRRMVLASALALGSSNLLIAGDVQTDDGPWLVPQNGLSKKLQIRSALDLGQSRLLLGFNHYQSRWTATDQIPERFALAAPGNRFASLDPTTGGITAQTSATAQWRLNRESFEWRANAWWMRYRLNLFSNFTYATKGCESEPLVDDCLSNNQRDQIEQADRRQAWGLAGSVSHGTRWGDLPLKLQAGLDLRRYNIGEVSLFETQTRQRTNAISVDSINLTQSSLWAQGQLTWHAQWRTSIGLRYDIHRSSFSGGQSLSSPKISTTYSPTQQLDLYANWGKGFHSNDSRINKTANNADIKSTLVPTTGYELGVRFQPSSQFFLTAAAWALKVNSELVFIGDAGTTEASRPSKRKGIELNANWKPIKTIEVDADLSRSSSRFTDGLPTEQSIPGAMEKVGSLGVTVITGPITLGLRARYFGGRALTEDNIIRSKAATTLNAKVEYAPNKQVAVSLSLLNLTNRQFNDIEYAYASRLANEAAFDESTPATRHFHPGAPRTARIALKLSF